MTEIHKSVDNGLGNLHRPTHQLETNGLTIDYQDSKALSVTKSIH